MNFGKTITLTFGDQAENHKGMQIIGEMAEEGFDFNDIQNSFNNFKSMGCQCEIINLNDYIDINASEAYIMIVRKGVDCILGEINKTSDDLFIEQTNLPVDKKAKMYGRIVNKHARHNLCFDEDAQEPDYNNGKGRIIAFEDVPLTNFIRDVLPNYFGNKSENLMVEGNYYYDVNKCGIGFHGDSERKRVIGIRLGETLPLHYQWFKDGEPIGERIKLKLNHGDIYIMSEKATGFD